MIEIIKGEVVAKGEQFLVLLTGGVGMKVWTTPSICASVEIGDKTQLFTDLILRENDINLYGFQDKKARELFRVLIKVNGVGPKASLSILSVMPVMSIYQAVYLKDAQRFVNVPGIGHKTAQKIILYLQDTLEPLPDGMEFDSAAIFDTELLDALVGLGYSIAEAQASIQSLPKDTEKDLEVRLRLALQFFSK